MTASNTSLLGFVETLERHARSAATIKAMEKETCDEAKSMGFDVPTIKRVVKARIKTADEIVKEQEARAEKEALFQIYCASLGMLDGTPLGDAARDRLAKEFKEKEDDKPKPKKGRGKGAAVPDDEEPAAEPPPPPVTLGPEEIGAARAAGEDAHRSGISVLKNPYTAGDPRRASWDEGWCAEAGSDGMDIPAAYRRTPKKKPDDEAPAPGADAPEGAPGR
jgi:uncharacterized protein (UPF0335 family)